MTASRTTVGRSNPYHNLARPSGRAGPGKCFSSLHCTTRESVVRLPEPRDPESSVVLRRQSLGPCTTRPELMIEVVRVPADLSRIVVAVVRDVAAAGG